MSVVIGDYLTVKVIFIEIFNPGFGALVFLVLIEVIDLVH